MTVAKFSIIKVVIFAVANFAIVIVVLYYSFHRAPGAAFWQITLSPRVWIHGRFVALLVSPVIIVKLLNFVWRVISAGGSSVWIASGEPQLLNFYTDAGFSRVLLTDIDHFSIVPFKAFRPAMVAVHLKNGLLERIPTLLMVESAESIKDRLMTSMSWKGRRRQPRLSPIEAHERIWSERQGHIIDNLSELKRGVDGLYRRFWAVAVGVITLLVSACGGLIYLILTRAT